MFKVWRPVQGADHPLDRLEVLGTILQFGADGVARVEHLEERVIHRLRAFGFRVERTADPPKATPEAPARRRKEG